jgi:hypothetical protein
MREINMHYDIALGLAWDEIGRLSQSSRYVIPLLTETYEVNIDIAGQYFPCHLAFLQMRALQGSSSITS